MSGEKHLSFFKLMLPIFVQSLLMLTMGYADTMMISQKSPLSVGAVGNANQITSFLTLAFNIISGATGTVVCQYLGGRRKNEINRIYTTSLAFNFILGITLAICVFFFRRAFISFLKVPSEMREMAAKYLAIRGLFIFTDALLAVFFQIFNSNGKTYLGMFIITGVNILNILGNYSFLYGSLSFLKMDVEGLALSTAVSGLAAVFVCYFLFKKILGASFSIKELDPFPVDILKKLFTLGTPGALENVSFTSSQLVLASFVNLMGSTYVNARIFCIILASFSMIFSISTAGASAIITGFLVGEKKFDEARQKVFRSLFLSLPIAFFVASLNYLLSSKTLRFFTNDPLILSVSSTVMKIAIFLELGRTANLVVIQSLKAAGDVIFPFGIGVLSMWGISVLGSYIFAVKSGGMLNGVWICMAADEIFRGIAVTLRWKSGAWKKKALA